MLSRIKKNDEVLVKAGKDRGKQGLVISVDRKNDRVIVKGAGIKTRHVKPRRQGEKGGRVEEEGYIALSKVMPICPSCNKACRVQVKFMANESKARSCHRCKEAF